MFSKLSLPMVLPRSMQAWLLSADLVMGKIF